MYYCDTAWHKGSKKDANFLITTDDEEVSSAFATCSEHAGRALTAMTVPNRTVRVRRVSNTDKKEN